MVVRRGAVITGVLVVMLVAAATAPATTAAPSPRAALIAIVTGCHTKPYCGTYFLKKNLGPEGERLRALCERYRPGGIARLTKLEFTDNGEEHANDGDYELICRYSNYPSEGAQVHLRLARPGHVFTFPPCSAPAWIGLGTCTPIPRGVQAINVGSPLAPGNDGLVVQTRSMLISVERSYVRGTPSLQSFTYDRAIFRRLLHDFGIADPLAP